MLGNFQDGTVAGKIQFGSGWWFLDQKDGMEKQMNALSVLGLLSRFVGMLTDSRSFLSYPRHEYFRRTLCNLVGRDVENGEIPISEMERVNQMIEDISYYNAKKFINFFYHCIKRISQLPYFTFIMIYKTNRHISGLRFFHKF